MKDEFAGVTELFNDAEKNFVGLILNINIRMFMGDIHLSRVVRHADMQRLPQFHETDFVAEREYYHHHNLTCKMGQTRSAFA